MSEHGGNGDNSKSEGVIVKSSKVELIDGTEELFFEFLMQGGSEGEFGNLSFEYVDEFADKKWGSTGRNDRSITGMCRELECNTSKHEVAGIGHDEAKVTMDAATMSGWDGTCISINFLAEEFKGGVCWHPSDQGQVWVRESNG